MNELSELHRSAIKVSDQDQDQPQISYQNSKNKRFSTFHCRLIYSILFVVLAASLYLLSNQPVCQPAQPIRVVDDNPRIITVLQRFQHDANCYTQGLSFINQTHILESCGLYKNSYVQILQYNKTKYPHSVTQMSKFNLSQASIFAEGSILFPRNQLIYLLTWRERKVLRFQYKNGQITQKDSLKWIYEGWGLTHDNQHLIISDGSHNLFITDEYLNVIKTIPIKDSKGRLITYLNQLQYVERPDGKKFIYANVYLTKKIVKIDYLEQKVDRIYDLAELVGLQPQAKTDEVLNGIAFDKKSSSFLLTGKKWQNLYLVKGL